MGDVFYKSKISSISTHFTMAGSYFIWLIFQLVVSPSGCLWVFFIFILLLLIERNNPFSKTKFRPAYLLVFLPFLVVPLMLIYGTILRTEFRLPPTCGSGNSVPPYLTTVLYVQVIFSLGVIYLMKGYRWFALILSLFQVSLSFLSWLLAIMSITGCWI